MTMMTLKNGMLVAAIALTLPMAMTSPSNAAPLASGAAVSVHEALNADNSLLTQVQWRGRRGGWRGGGAGLGIGLAAGALIGGAIAAGNGYGYGYGPGYYGPGYAPAPVYVEPGYAGGGDTEAYCMQRYRSYDPGSGTYLNNDGNRYPCP
jgi:BA14K-like protein